MASSNASGGAGAPAAADPAPLRSISGGPADGHRRGSCSGSLRLDGLQKEVSLRLPVRTTTGRRARRQGVQALQAVASGGQQGRCPGRDPRDRQGLGRGLRCSKEMSTATAPSLKQHPSPGCRRRAERGQSQPRPGRDAEISDPPGSPGWVHRREEAALSRNTRGAPPNQTRAWMRVLSP